MTTLLLVRHGETFDNAAHLMQGQVQGQLNETGIAQAEGVRDQMAREHIDAFVSSDLYRSVQTCEIIAEPHHKPLSLANTSLTCRRSKNGQTTSNHSPT